MSYNIYLSGFMGVGKTTIGKSLAAYLQKFFVDMDDIIKKRSGLSTFYFFEKYGEDCFRREEIKVLKDISLQKGLVVSVGGGVVENKENRRIMRETGIVIYLESSLLRCYANLKKMKNVDRPLIDNLKKFSIRYFKRLFFYSNSSDFLINVKGLRLGSIVDEILFFLLGKEVLYFNSNNDKTSIMIMSRIPSKIDKSMRNHKISFFCDYNVMKLHLERYRKIFLISKEILFPSGEKIKEFQSLGLFYNILSKSFVHRNSFLVVTGGGVTTDLGAFLAATYKRGLKFILCSTTLVGCVDAAIGGKSAVNLRDVKNQIGLFTFPLFIFLDLISLKTLFFTAVKEGLIEAYKTGLVFDYKLNCLIEKRLEQLLQGDLLEWVRVIRKAARAKVEIVTSDFKDLGLRRILNFGHTYGHALEAFYSYKLSHGQAVSMGIRLAIEVSFFKGLLQKREKNRINFVLGKIKIGKREWISMDKVWSILCNDKKNLEEGILFVLLSNFEEPLIIRNLSKIELDFVLTSLINGKN